MADDLQNLSAEQLARIAEQIEAERQRRGNGWVFKPNATVDELYSDIRASIARLQRVLAR